MKKLPAIGGDTALKIKTVLMTLFMIEILLANYFAYLWLTSNTHYFGRLFSARAMNVEKKVVEVSIK
ncbi:hypothetical protein A2313_02490 [Candidatus Roizmanbacteria bacterium RIFOXYB2_FULL_41_10]|uniref:Uncharacterized protein n=1 Tax=Candidatus Roizmanbacteria bacterium RIFOXYA1_FULL_41_12 TaxID=1802082 RepID=A0A1F7K9B3_9BACT|nr:MAG: hypothetical protein A2209_03965 [Candidatus Roizmanbacteria bacterium RIFOXYA1_FULL_41_12]OGK67847.1 MAG: hypothetical protein A2377_01965 [Candidatus Roizmanbacteria bacterium RIFOXYB1_FULL_41_27]OGK68209.1 MAG: hypothetical protein A2262_00010 [Candidatus Roizmanbacteria bacterium RIFOXYA2_FULL_41_8]OGK69230.1 MAG: hypothetical protein A2313_02490 [Candidatus Roizmanbacteria bacterium RIFOXYB2_FULL_41_10]OGK74694.1 MAG: hypothetical protein A2575_01225 [Candidatus Roizmanbacteria bac